MYCNVLEARTEAEKLNTSLSMKVHTLEGELTQLTEATEINK